MPSPYFYFISMAYYDKLASAIKNDVISGLRGYTATPTMSLKQLEDDIVDERLQIIKEYSLKGIIPKRDLLMSVNCIPVDCKDIENCMSCFDNSLEGTPTLHFEIPQILMEYGEGIEYIGSVDKGQPFIFYTNPTILKYHKHRVRAKNKPYVFIDITPNLNNMYDCYLFNVPLIKQVSLVAILKDLRQLSYYGISQFSDINNMTFIDAEIKKRLTEKKLRYYRQFAAPLTSNDQIPK